MMGAGGVRVDDEGEWDCTLGENRGRSANDGADGAEYGFRRAIRAFAGAVEARDLGW